MQHLLQGLYSANASGAAYTNFYLRSISSPEH